jgi:hypothetical protein
VVGVVAWITLVPLFDLFRHLLRAASSAAMPGRRASAEELSPASADQERIARPRVDRAA